MANQVASLTATITVDKGNLQKEVLQEFSNAQQTLDGKNLKVKIIGDTSEIEKAIKKLENLRNLSSNPASLADSNNMAVLVPESKLYAHAFSTIPNS